MKKFLTVSSVAALMVAATNAQAASFVFPSDSTAFSSATNGGGTIPSGGQSAYMWTSGDFISQTISGTGLASVGSFQNSFMIENITGGTDLSIAALIDGTTVGMFDIVACGFCRDIQTIDVSFSFGAIAGAGSYDISYVLQNTLAGGDGSIAFLDGGRGTLTSAVPEPATWAFMIFGFGAIGGAMRRQKNMARKANVKVSYA